MKLSRISCQKQEDEEGHGQLDWITTNHGQGWHWRKYREQRRTVVNSGGGLSMMLANLVSRIVEGKAKQELFAVI